MSLIESYDYFFNNELQFLISKKISKLNIINILAVTNFNSSIFIGNVKSVVVLRSTFVESRCERC